MNIRDIGEFGLIAKIKELVSAPSENVLLGIDDDAAAIELPDGQILLLTTDALLEGIHFDLSYFNFYKLGWRALAASISDIAAMGGQPQYALVTLSVPPDLSVENVTELVRGMKDLASTYQTSIVGGDTIESPDKMQVSVTVTGLVAKDDLVPRSGARIGDTVFVTGCLGGAQAGLKVLKSSGCNRKLQTHVIDKHLPPKPRVEEARFLVENFSIHSMIDISDGLASEIHHICQQSHVGAELIAEQIPIESETESVAEHFGEAVLEYALYGGEDFELLFTAPEERVAEICEQLHWRFGLSCTKIGRITRESKGIVLEMPDGKRRELSRGYRHFLTG
ncbi:MAG: thiamine-phosphate kinase [bacterium]